MVQVARSDSATILLLLRLVRLEEVLVFHLFGERDLRAVRHHVVFAADEALALPENVEILVIQNEVLQLVEFFEIVLELVQQLLVVLPADAHEVAEAHSLVVREVIVAPGQERVFPEEALFELAERDPLPLAVVFEVEVLGQGTALQVVQAETVLLSVLKQIFSRGEFDLLDDLPRLLQDIQREVFAEQVALLKYRAVFEAELFLELEPELEWQELE